GRRASAGSPRSRCRSCVQSDRDEHRVLLDGDWIEPQAATAIRERPAGEQIELPAMPRAGEDLALAAPAELAGRRGERGSTEAAAADRRLLVRADVEHRHKRAVDVEHPDRASLDLDDLPLTGWDLADFRDR